MKHEKKIIVVLGMHRSGTSAATRALQALGIELGNNLLPPVVGDNDRGYYEDADINKLNIELLNALNVEWSSLSPIELPAVENEKIAVLKKRACDLLQSKTHERTFALKDPRMARLLPFWKDIFDNTKLSASYVIAVRHPISVVRSLSSKIRGIMPETKGYYLWLQHNIAAFLGTFNESRIFVDFDLLVEDPRKQLARMANFLGLDIATNTQEVEKFVIDFLDPELRHNKSQSDELDHDPTIPSNVVSTYKMLQLLAMDKIHPADSKTTEFFGDIDSTLATMAPIFGYATTLEHEVSSLKEDASNTIATLHNRLEENHIATQTLNLALNEERLINEQLNTTLEERRLLIESLNSALKENSMAVVTLSAALQECNQGLIRTTESVTTKTNIIAGLTSELEAIKASRTWRMLQRASCIKRYFFRH